MGKSGVKKKAPKQLKFSFKRQQEINELILRVFELSEQEHIEIEKTLINFKTRLTKLENIAAAPVVIENTNLTQEMLMNLKKGAAAPVIVSTPPPKPFCFNHEVIPGPCNNCKGGTVANHGPQPEKYNIAKERNLKTLETVRFALRMMKGITYTVSETSFKICIRRYNDIREINVQSFDQKQFFSEVRYSDLNGKPRSAGYQTLALVCADVTAICMYYATR